MLKEDFMLVLSRQSDETIIIGDNIRVTIVEGGMSLRFRIALGELPRRAKTPLAVPTFISVSRLSTPST